MRQNIKRLLIAVSALVMAFLPVSTVMVFADPTISEYQIPTSSTWPYNNVNPSYITNGPDGALWFADGYNIGRISTSGSVTMYPIYYPVGNVITGPDGALWFTEYSGSMIGRMTTSGVVSWYTLPVSGIAYITNGPGGSMWFDSLSSVGSINASGVVTAEYSIPAHDAYPGPITTGPNGALWFTEPGNTNEIDSVTTSGNVAAYPIPTSNAYPSSIAAGPDGALWFTEQSSNKIGRITTNGVISEYPIAVTTSPPDPSDITTGPDGALWFTEYSPSKIGRITTAGVISDYVLPGSTQGDYYGPKGITVGPDEALWFTEESNSIGRLQPQTAPSAPTNLTLTTPNPTNQAPGLSLDTVSGATSYNVYRNGNTTPIATVPAPSSGTTVTYTDTSAPQGTDSYYVTAVNTGGESPASNTVSDLYDTTPPTITYSLSPTANSNGWNNSATTVTFNCSDPTTGVTITACSSPTTVSNDGANQQVTGTATDSAGNTTSVIATVNVDSTAPTITSSLNVAPNAAGWNNTPVTVSYTCNDATSGIASCSAPQTESTDGSYTLSGTATDNAGNSSSINTTVNIDQTPPSVSSVTFGSNPLAMDATTTLTASVSDNLSGVNKVEYYVGTDPGAGNGSSMTYDSSTGTASASFGPFTTPGTYTVYVRSQDVAGNWSSPQALTFTVYPAAANLSLAPSSQTGTVGGSVSFTATATDTSNNPVAGITVHYDVSGSVTTSGSCVTDSTGTCTFSYTGPQLPGADLVDAYADNNNNGTQDQNEPTTNASVSWDLPPNSTTSGSVHGHGRFIASNGDHMNVAFHAVNQNGTVTGACNIVDQTTNVVYSCTDATVLVENTTTGQATIFGDITINGTATTYRMDVADNSATNQPDTFNFVTQSGYSVGGTMDSNAKVVVN